MTLTKMSNDVSTVLMSLAINYTMFTKTDTQSVHMFVLTLVELGDTK